MVKLAVPAAVPVILTGVVVPKLKLGGSCAPLGPEVTSAVSATLPVKPPVGVTVMVDVFADDAPAVTDTAFPLTEKLGFTVVVTVTASVPVARL